MSMLAQIKKHSVWVLFVTLLAIPFGLAAQGQIPQSLNYQAVARDENGYPIINKEIVVEITIRANWEQGEIAWQETHQVTTNEFGLFALQIGKGRSTYMGEANAFADIDWTESDYYIQSRVDFGTQQFGDGLVDMGVTKMQSVPYALVADSVINAPKPDLTMGELKDVDLTDLLNNEVLVWDGQKWAPDQSFVRTDGTTDLTNDWTITDDNITLNNGLLTASGVITDALQIGAGTTVNTISVDGSLGGSNASDDILATQKAVKTYVDGVNSEGSWELNGSYLFNLNENIGIGTSTPSDKFQADIGDKGFLVTGTYQPATPTGHSGTGTLMAFYPSKAAFRVGRIESDNVAWNNDQIGTYSFASGLDTRATGAYSVSMGYKNHATGARSLAVGQETTSSGISSMAAGFRTDAAGAYSAAFGQYASAAADGSAAFGFQTSTSGAYSLVFGNGSSISSGSEGAVAGGENAQAQGKAALSVGVSTRATSLAEVAFGRFNHSTKADITSGDTWIAGDFLFTIGVGTDNANRSNAFSVMKSGNVGVGLGTNSPSARFQVGTSGDGSQALSNGWNTFSDKRLKTDIQPLPQALSKVKQLNGYYYRWKKGADKSQQVGVIAQEVEAVLPEIVATNKQGIKTVDYSKLTPLLIEALKEQQALIDELKNKNKQQASELSEMKAQVNQLDERLQLIEQVLTNTADK